MVNELMWQATRNEKQTIGTSSAIVSNARPSSNERNTIMLRNTSVSDTAVITINVGDGAAVANEGIVLNKNDVWTDSSETGYKCTQSVITAISNEADAQLSIFERGM